MSIWAIIPVKSLHNSKSRLAHLLSAEARAGLILRFFTQTLAVLHQTPAIDQILVVSSDSAVLTLARQQGAQTLVEPRPQGLNTAVALAVQTALAAQATTTLILPADLPFIQAKDVTLMLQTVKQLPYGGGGNGSLNGSSQQRPFVAICTDNKNDGTNALLIHHAGLTLDFTFHYGSGSFKQHIREAERHGLPCYLVNAPGLKFDLDTEEDWRFYQAYQVGMIT